MPEPTVSVTPDEIASFHQHGFLSVPRPLSTAAELAAMAQVYDRLFAEMVGWEEGNAFDLAGTDDGEANLPQILGPSRYAPELRETLYFANALHISRQLLGAEAGGGGDHAILKPPLRGAATPWHQDEAYWDPALDYTSLSVWVPLQEATPENGCMQFVPGTHRLEVLPHHTLGNDPRIHALELDDLDTMRELLAQAVACPLPAGGATFHLSRTFHYTGPNRSAGPRRAHVIGFGLPAVPRGDGRRFPWNEAKRTAREARRAEFEAAKPPQA